MTSSEFHEKELVYSVKKVAPIRTSSPSPSPDPKPGDKNLKTRMPWKHKVIFCMLIIVCMALLIVGIVPTVFLGLQTDRINHLETSQQRLEKTIMNLTLSQNQQRLPPEQLEAQNFTTRLFVISHELAEFRINFTIELSQVKASVLSNISELVRHILVDVQLSQQNITTLFIQRLTQHELKINQNFEELGN